METPHANGNPYMGRWKDYTDFRRWVVVARRQKGLTQEGLGELVGLSKVSIRKIERGQTLAPKYETVRSIIAALDAPDGGSPLNGGTLVPPAREERSGEVDRLPVYRWGAVGDPRAPAARPIPELRGYPPGRESLVGVRGFGVIAQDDQFSAYGIGAFDVAWCNPDIEPTLGMPAIVLRDGLEIAVYERGTGNVVGPVVCITSSRTPVRPRA